MQLPKRKPNRLAEYDYSTPGAYFLTLCTEDKRCILGRVVGGGAFDAPHVQLAKAGEIARKYLLSGDKIPGIRVEKFVIMPNHIHVILWVEDTAGNGPSRSPAPTNQAVPHFISTFKCFCHRDFGSCIFQRSYHDRIIRNEPEYLKIWKYIDDNPALWDKDCFYQE